MNSDRRLGLGALVGIVFGMVVGSGLYNIPQNLAVGAGPVSVGVAWIVTAIGMLLLVATLKILADRHPDLDAGIYQYAQVAFGNFAGFNIAWGYWLCASFANIAYAVMLNDSFGAFIPALLDHSWPTLLFGTLLIWLMYFIVAGGIKTAKLLNNTMAVIKVVAIGLIIVLLALNIKYGVLSLNLMDERMDPDSMLGQVKSTMLVTLWCFIGIEGAVMMSARAKRPKDVGKAGVLGFLVAWLMYVLVSMLCYGVMERARLAGLEDPSVAYVLKAICGEWAYYFVILSVIVSLLGGWLSWTLVCAQVPYEAAVVKIFPSAFLHINRHGMPEYGLLVSSLIMEGFLVIVMMADDIYMAALSITGMMVLPAYLSGGLYLLKLSCCPQEICEYGCAVRWRYRIIGTACSLYCLWLIYAGGMSLFVFTSFFYLAGIGFYVQSRKERRKSGELKFTRADKITLGVLIAGLISASVMLANGVIPF